MSRTGNLEFGGGPEQPLSQTYKFPTGEQEVFYRFRLETQTTVRAVSCPNAMEESV